MGGMAYILDENRRPIPADVVTWGKWREIDENIRVGQTKVGEVLVSTVFLGIDHNFLGRGKPILFETLVFGGPLNDEMDRYRTWKEAELGHKEMVERVEAAAVGESP